MGNCKMTLAITIFSSVGGNFLLSEDEFDKVYNPLWNIFGLETCNFFSSDHF